MKELKDALSRLNRKDFPATMPAKVISVDAEQGTCVVEIDGNEYDEVRLAAIQQSDNTRYLLPAVDSQVLVSIIEDDLNLLYVVAYSALDAIDITIGATNITANADKVVIDHNGNQLKIDADGHVLIKDQAKYELSTQGHSIKNGSENLAQVLLDLLQAIQQLTVTNSAGPTGVPNNVAAFAALQPRIENLLNND